MTGNNIQREENNQHLNPFRSIWKSDPKRPVFSALLEAELRRFDYLYSGLLTDIDNTKSEEAAITLFNKIIVTAKEGTEILTWIFPQRALSFDEAFEIAKRMSANKFPSDMYESVIKNAGKRRKGRPITKRSVAIKALEKKILEPKRKWSHRELAQQFCDCGKATHDHQCSESLRQSMIQLKKILKKYCPDFTM